MEECATEDIVYSFEVGPIDQNDIVPCGGRNLPSSCYTILIALNEAALLAVAEVEQVQEDKADLGWVWGLIIGLGVLALVYYLRKRKALQSPNGLIAIGRFLFDPMQAKLKMNDQDIELTSKESDLLLLLHERVNRTIERDELLNRVWGDQGDYVGRTLDVFISKLRKKLEGDPDVKIVNVRGVGYKLVLAS